MYRTNKTAISIQRSLNNPFESNFNPLQFDPNLVQQDQNQKKFYNNIHTLKIQNDILKQYRTTNLKLNIVGKVIDPIVKKNFQQTLQYEKYVKETFRKPERKFHQNPQQSQVSDRQLQDNFTLYRLNRPQIKQVILEDIKLEDFDDE